LVAAVGARATLAWGLVALAASVGLLMVLDPDTTIVVVLVAALLIGLLIAITVPPATAVIMNDLGEDKAGDGGAVNQLARQVGGALGVAIVGTVFAALYAARIDERLRELATAERERATESIEEARDVADAAAAPLREVLLGRADEAFDAAARGGFGVCAGILLLAAAVATVTLGRQASGR
jgi:hypothetical protein